MTLGEMSEIGSEKSYFCPKRDREIRHLCPKHGTKQGQGLSAWAAPPYLRQLLIVDAISQDRDCIDCLSLHFDMPMADLPGTNLSQIERALGSPCKIHNCPSLVSLLHFSNLASTPLVPVLPAEKVDQS